jgi:Mn-dependent DtxR family transcriptional regulator
MLVFSTIYQLEEQGNREITYKLLSKTLKLSESSIRDYVQRMINKGISIQKEKVNNKKLLLTISPNLKKIASLPTIIQLREL